MAKTEKALHDAAGEAEAPAQTASIQHGTMVRTTAEILAKQPKRAVRLPTRDDVKQRFVMVWINGHSFQIKRGVDVEVPESVYKILVESGEI